MAQNSGSTIPTDKFLLIAVNLLHKVFIDATRTEAKQVYRNLDSGRTLGLTNVEMEDESTLRINLSLERSEFTGQLNFGAFKASLSNLLGNIARTLQEGKEVTVFSVEGKPNSVLFGITGVTFEDAQPNVMVLGSDVGDQPGVATLRLMYLDPEQFAQNEQDSAGDTTQATS